MNVAIIKLINTYDHHGVAKHVTLHATPSLQLTSFFNLSSGKKLIEVADFCHSLLALLLMYNIFFSQKKEGLHYRKWQIRRAYKELMAGEFNTVLHR